MSNPLLPPGGSRPGSRVVGEIARDDRRWIEFVSACPARVGAAAGRGIDRADWRPMDEDRDHSCLDRRNYRPKKFRRRGPEVS